MWILLATFALADGPCPRKATYYRDLDGDGWGDESAPKRMCVRREPYPGRARLAGDCDDTDVSVYPEAVEWCDGKDNDCDGAVDEDPGDGALRFADGDGDGWGDAATPAYVCADAAGWAETSGDCDDGDAERTTICDPVDAYQVAWGDLHVHTGWSMDGCEDPDNWCRALGDTPAEYLVGFAVESGLDFFAVTDHAEFDEWGDTVSGESGDIWDASQQIVAAAEGSGVIAILGYEFTARWGHRTVILDTDTACDDWRKAGGSLAATKAGVGYETYTAAASSGLNNATEFQEAMAATSSASGCADVRYLSWRHHPAYLVGTVEDWDADHDDYLDDYTVEIASQHGSSECVDTSMDGCDYHVGSTWDGKGAVQKALQVGLPLGFVGGSDRHDARPWSRGESPSYSGHFADEDGDGVGETPSLQGFSGAITGVLYTGSLDRSGIFDAIEARHTVASSWNFSGLQITLVGDDGTVWWPGDTVPAGHYSVFVDLDDPEVASWSWELIDPATLTSAGDEGVDLGSGERRYVRIRATVDGYGEEQRVWASPFFVE